MAHYIRMSPQPFDDPVVVSLDGKTKTASVPPPPGTKGETISSTASNVFPSDVDDQVVANSVMQDIVPRIARRNNVTLLFEGHALTGKTCLMEQLGPQIVEALKPTIVSCDEAHQEMLAISGEPVSRRSRGDEHLEQLRQQLNATRSSTHRSVNATSMDSLAPNHSVVMLSGVAGGKGGDQLSAGIGAGPAAGSPSKSMRGRSMRARSVTPSKSKYSLMVASLPRDAAIEMSEIELMRPQSAMGCLEHPLLPDLVHGSYHSQSRGGSRGAGAERSMSASHVGPTSSKPGTAAAGGDDGAGARPSSRMHAKLERARSPLRFTTGLVTTLGAKNGRPAGPHTTLHLTDGAYLEFPPIAEMDVALKTPDGLFINMWIQIDESSQKQQCALFHLYDPIDPNFMVRCLLNTSETGGQENDTALISVRDSHSKLLESTFMNAICDGEWHYITIHLCPVQKSIGLSVDGRALRPKIVSQEVPEAFYDEHVKTGFFASSMALTEDGKMTPTMPLECFIFDLHFASNPHTAFAKYPLKSSVDRVFEEMHKSFGPFAVKGSFEFVDVEFPATAPWFDGKGTFINVGSLGDFGLLPNGGTIEVTLRTACTTDPMCVIGVVDTMGKHPGFGLVINMNNQMQFQRCACCIFLTDYNGNTIRCGAEIPDLFDDRWHTLTVRIQDLSISKFKLRMDGRPVDVSTTTTDGVIPSEFVCYSQYVSVGCLNNRGVHQYHYRGSMKQLRLSRLRDDADECVASLLLDEGPGAHLAMDNTAHGFNGILFLHKKLKGSLWLPGEGEAAALEETTLVLSDDTSTIKRHDNNVVTMAFCVVITRTDPKSCGIQQVLRDLIHKIEYTTLEQVTYRTACDRTSPDDSRSFFTIPEECYRRVTPSDFNTTFRNALRASEDFKKAHVVAVLRLGDAMFTIIDLASFSKSARAKFSPQQMSWADSVSTFGSTNKINLAVNHSVTKTEKLLLQVGARPQLYRRSTLMNPSTPTTSDDMLTNILSFAMLSGQDFSELFSMAMVAPFTSHMEGQQTIRTVEVRRKQNHVHAAIVIQKLFRLHRARNVYNRKVIVKEAADARHERISYLKKQFPKDTQEKSKKTALLIICSSFEYDDKMPLMHTAFDDARSIPRMCEQLGYTPELMLNPCRANLLTALEERIAQQKENGEALLVYLIGIGMDDFYHVPPPNAKEQQWLMEAERKARIKVLDACYKEWREAREEQFEEMTYIVAQLKQAAEEVAAKNAKKKKKKNAKAAPVVEIPIPEVRPLEDKTAYIEQLRAAWNAVVAPEVPPLTPEALAAAVKAEELAVAALESTLSNTSMSATGGGRSPHGKGSHKDRHSPDHTDASKQKDRFLLVSDTTRVFSPENTLPLAQLKNMLIPDVPMRGHHTMFFFDCISLPSSTMQIGGFGGLYSTSHEEVFLEYRKGQRQLLTYYFKKCLQGAAVECVRRGKNPPPSKVSIETACQYLTQKLGPEAPRSVLSLDIKWFGEYVGDMFIAPKLLTQKEDRKKNKVTNAIKKSITQIDLLLTGNVKTEYRAPLQTAAGKMARVQLADLRRVHMNHYFEIAIQGDFIEMSQHEIAIDEIEETIYTKMYPGYPREGDGSVSWTVTKQDPPRIVIRPPIPSLEQISEEVHDGKKDQRSSAHEFVVKTEQRTQKIDNLIIAPINAIAAAKLTHIGRYPIVSTCLGVQLFVFLSEDETLRVEREIRRGAAIDDGVFTGCHVLGDRDLQEYDQADKHIHAEDQRRQAEAKQKMMEDAEKRKKEEERQAQLKLQKEAMLTKLQQARSYNSLAVDDLAFFFSVPLLDAYQGVAEGLAGMCSKDTADVMEKGGLAERVHRILSHDVPACAKDIKLLASLWKLTNAIVAVGKTSLAAALATDLLRGHCLPLISEASISMRVVESALSGIQQGGGRVADGTLYNVGSVWSEVTTAGRTADLANLLLGLTSNADELVAPAVVTAFGISPCSLALDTLVSKGSGSVVVKSTALVALGLTIDALDDPVPTDAAALVASLCTQIAEPLGREGIQEFANAALTRLAEKAAFSEGQARAVLAAVERGDDSFKEQMATLNAKLAEVFPPPPPAE